MDTTKLDGQQRNALLAFKDALQRKREGKTATEPL
jgi:hypothetical protein